MFLHDVDDVGLVVDHEDLSSRSVALGHRRRS